MKSEGMQLNRKIQRSKHTILGIQTIHSFVSLSEKKKQVKIVSREKLQN